MELQKFNEQGSKKITDEKLSAHFCFSAFHCFQGKYFNDFFRESYRNPLVKFKTVRSATLPTK